MSAAILRHPAYIEWPADPRDRLPLTLWTAKDIADAVGGTASHDFQVAGVEMDSRDVVNGDLFVALRGEAMDGHRFLEKAFANGAAGAIVDRPIDWPHILVDDTTEALKALARAARNRVEAKIIGVTGSVGKTGTKEALYLALDRAAPGQAHRSVKSYNNHVGVPLSLARMPAKSIASASCSNPAITARSRCVFDQSNRMPPADSSLPQPIRPDSMATRSAPAGSSAPSPPSRLLLKSSPSVGRGSASIRVQISTAAAWSGAADICENPFVAIRLRLGIAAMIDKPEAWPE